MVRRRMGWRTGVRCNAPTSTTALISEKRNMEHYEEDWTVIVVLHTPFLKNLKTARRLHSAVLASSDALRKRARRWSAQQAE